MLHNYKIKISLYSPTPCQKNIIIQRKLNVFKHICSSSIEMDIEIKEI